MSDDAIRLTEPLVYTIMSMHIVEFVQCRYRQFPIRF
jgi:hypothetical protein